MQASMVSRSEILAIILSLVLGPLLFLVKLEDPAFITSHSSILFLVATLPIYAYAAYWAFGVRNSLAVPMYRRQALSVGLLTLTIWLTSYAFIILEDSPNLQFAYPFLFITFAIVLLAYFYFTDITMKTSRRSDPLLRDTLYWSKLRIPLWIIVGFTMGSIIGLAAFTVITSNTALLNDFVSGDFQNPVINFINNYLTFVPFVGVIVLPVVAYRAKWDRALRRHFFWLALATAFLLIEIDVDPPGFIILFLALGYFLYRSVRSLAPVSKISERVEGPSKPDQ